MKEIPILFSTPMVQAVDAGNKTVTRRIVKFPKFLLDCLEDNSKAHDLITFNRMQSGYKEGVRPVFEIEEDADTAFSVKSRYGQVGDILWVRESWQWDWVDHSERNEKMYRYKSWDPQGITLASGEYWLPSIHMPRVACRRFLKVVSVHVEKLHEITDEQATKEGITFDEKSGFYFAGDQAMGQTPRDAFRELWYKINGVESWDANPWVWAIEFKVITNQKTT